MYTGPNLTRLFVFALFLFPAASLAAQEVEVYSDQAVGICYKQPEMRESELKRALSAMRTIIEKKGELSAEEEEALISKSTLSADRLNCLMGKLMAANDVFAWGRADDYGVPLTEKETRIAAKYKKDSLMLKKYMEDVLNIQVE